MLVGGPRRLSPVLLTVVLVAIGLVTPGPAAAAQSDSDKYGTLKVADLRTNGTRCVKEVVEYVPTSKIFDWTLEVSVSDSNGDDVAGFELNPTTRKRTFTLCPHRERAGHFRVDGHLNGNSESDPTGGCCSVSNAYDSVFTFRVIDRKPTRLTVTVARSTSENCPGFEAKPRHCSVVKGRLTRSGKPWGWDYVQIQAYKKGKWVRQAWGRGDGLGRVTWYATITAKEKKLKFRLFFETHDYAKGSVSRTFTMKY